MKFTSTWSESLRSLTAVLFVLPATLSIGACASEAMPESQSSNVSVRASAAEQARMQAYIDSMIDMRFARTTFNAGPAYEGFCVDFDKQPACLAMPGACPAAPPTPPPTPPGLPVEQPHRTAVEPICPNGTVPITRPRLETMRRFATLEEYLHGFKSAPPSMERRLGAAW